ncbi:MAG: NAD(P)H-dependent oxidoreductase [Eubacteriaceae bacterium]|nr:NAD(P)H-dependent oxidoreductase [Eubacteriaceae bacterium]
MKKLLFVNSCVNRDWSRTQKLSDALLDIIKQGSEYSVEEIVLENEGIKFLTSEDVTTIFQLIEDEEFENEIFHYAHQFKQADLVVIASPYWNASFPAIVKAYLEMISWPGITFKYGSNLKMVGLCKAEKLYFVTTRGGYIGDGNDLAFATFAEMATGLGVREVKCISADGLDIDTNDPEAIMAKAIAELPAKL